MLTPLVLVLPNIRSAWNVGAILRTADAADVKLVITCGYTPHPGQADDPRPAHVVSAHEKMIAKTALGAERTVPLQHFDQLADAIGFLRRQHYMIAALEQAESSVNLFDFTLTGPLALIVGNEVSGLNQAELTTCDHILELPMLGRKESLNVAVGASIALYQLRFGG